MRMDGEPGYGAWNGNADAARKTGWGLESIFHPPYRQGFRHARTTGKTFYGPWKRLMPDIHRTTWCRVP
jgi:hypothetical protein